MDSRFHDQQSESEVDGGYGLNEYSVPLDYITDSQSVQVLGPLMSMGYDNESTTMDIERDARCNRTDHLDDAFPTRINSGVIDDDEISERFRNFEDHMEWTGGVSCSEDRFCSLGTAADLMNADPLVISTDDMEEEK